MRLPDDAKPGHFFYVRGVDSSHTEVVVDNEHPDHPEDFNQYHNTFSGFTVDGFTSSDQLVAKHVVTARQVASLASS